MVKQLFKKTAVFGSRFPIGRLIEDEYYCISAAQRANKIQYIPDKLYDYRQREGSLLKTSDADEKLTIGRKLCLPLAEKISASAEEMAIVAYISSAVKLYKRTGTITQIPQRYFSVVNLARKKKLISARTFRRFNYIYKHQKLAKIYFLIRKLFVFQPNG